MNPKQTLLILDEDPHCQNLISETLGNLVHLIFNPLNYSSFNPDVIIVDLITYGVKGYDLCRQFHLDPQLKHSKIILCSPNPSPEERLKTYQAGACDHWSKPFIREELLIKGISFLKQAQEQKDQIHDLNNPVQKQINFIHLAQMKALREMAGGMAHEINTPLGTLLLSSEQIEYLAQTGSLPTENLIKLTEGMRKSIQRISRIIQALRTFCRDNIQENPILIPAHEFIQNTLELCTESLKKRSIELQVKISEANLLLFCRPNQMTQAILHLLTNARDAIESKKEKWIHLEVNRKDPFIEISITDSGSIVSKEVNDHLFHPFFSTKEIGQGSGLGLSISQGIAEMHQGELKFDRESKNTCFILRIPNHQQPPS